MSETVANELDFAYSAVPRAERSRRDVDACLIDLRGYLRELQTTLSKLDSAEHPRALYENVDAMHTKAHVLSGFLLEHRRNQIAQIPHAERLELITGLQTLAYFLSMVSRVGEVILIVKSLGTTETKAISAMRAVGDVIGTKIDEMRTGKGDAKASDVQQASELLVRARRFQAAAEKADAPFTELLYGVMTARDAGEKARKGASDKALLKYLKVFRVALKEYVMLFEGRLPTGMIDEMRKAYGPFFAVIERVVAILEDLEKMLEATQANLEQWELIAEYRQLDRKLLGEQPQAVSSDTISQMASSDLDVTSFGRSLTTQREAEEWSRALERARRTLRVDEFLSAFARVEALQQNIRWNIPRLDSNLQILCRDEQDIDRCYNMFVNNAGAIQTIQAAAATKWHNLDKKFENLKKVRTEIKRTIVEAGEMLIDDRFQMPEPF